MSHACSSRGDDHSRRPLALAAGLAALLASASVALAQPSGVTVNFLGNFSFSTSTLQQPSVIATPAAPVQWYSITLPRIAAPHRFLDISTSGPSLYDPEIALYGPDGTLLATDDDDGAATQSALSFGITDVNAPGRVPPIIVGSQSPGLDFNGRDGELPGSPATGTDVVYYIAVTEYDAIFANGFSVTRANPSVPLGGLLVALTVRMNTPGGQLPPSLSAGDTTEPLGRNSIRASADTSENATDVFVDLSSVAGPAVLSLNRTSPTRWSRSVTVPALSQLGTFPMIYRATNAIGDWTVRNRTITVRPRANTCFNAVEQGITTTPGTTIYTYTTTGANVDGPWTNACFSPNFPPTGNDVWFRFEPTQNGTLTLSTCNSDTGVTSTQPDTLLGFRGRCDDAGFSTCADDTPGCGVGTRLANIPITAGQEYNIAVRAWGSDIVGGKLAATFVPGCDGLDFNNDTLTPDSGDLDDFLAVLSGGPSACSSFPAPGCNDLDFNNDGFSPDSLDLDAFISRLGGGPCLQ